MRRTILAASVAVAFVTGPVAAADVVILDSTAPGIAAGAVVDDSVPVAIPAGASVSMIMSDGETRLVEGPFEGPLATAVGAASGAGAALTATRGGDTRVLGAVRAPNWDSATE